MPTTATPPRFDNLVAVSKGSKIKPLGYIAWFSVPDEDVSLRRLRKNWQLAGLDAAVLPKNQRAVNAFKRAVRDQAGTRRDEVTGTVTETDVRDVVETAQDVVYQLSRVVRDTDERLVEYPKALRVWFSKETGDIDYKPLGGVDRRELLPIMEAIQEHFDRNTKSVTGAKVRGLVRQYIKDDSDERAGLVGLSGEPMGGSQGRPGSPYFVLARHAEQLESLGEFLSETYPDRAYLNMISLADGASEREMVRRAHVTNSVTEMEVAMADVAELLREDRKRGVRSDVASHHWGVLQRFRRRAAQYAEVLQDEQDEVQARLELLNRQLRALV